MKLRLLFSTAFLFGFLLIAEEANAATYFLNNTQYWGTLGVEFRLRLKCQPSVTVPTGVMKEQGYVQMGMVGYYPEYYFYKFETAGSHIHIYSETDVRVEVDMRYLDSQGEPIADWINVTTYQPPEE